MSSHSTDSATGSAKGWYAISLGLIALLVVSNLATALFARGQHAQAEYWKQRWNGDTTELAGEIRLLGEALTRSTAERVRAQNLIVKLEEALSASTP